MRRGFTIQIQLDSFQYMFLGIKGLYQPEGAGKRLSSSLTDTVEKACEVDDALRMSPLVCTQKGPLYQAEGTLPYGQGMHRRTLVL